MDDFWQTLGAVSLGGALTFQSGYWLWKAERREALREHRREEIREALGALYDASNAINHHKLSVDQGHDSLEIRVAVRHAVNAYLKCNMWLGGPFEERGGLIAEPIWQMEQALGDKDNQALIQRANTLEANIMEVMAQYRAMREEVDRQELGVVSAVLAKIKATRT